MTYLGKTYASYYAMERILNSKDHPKGICVYVAPTKALVNQVAGKKKRFLFIILRSLSD
jgi:superfamily II RNA helicase